MAFASRKIKPGHPGNGGLVDMATPEEASRLVVPSEIALPNRIEVLDELLPLLEPCQTELHENVTVLEASEVAQLVELAAAPKIRRYLLARLSDTIALVDPRQSKALAKALLAEGHTPKMVKGTQS